MIFIILFIGLLLRLVIINQSLWLDEAVQVVLSQKDVSSIWFDRQADFHPPLSYLMYHYWLQYGSSEVWLRIIPITFGVLTIFGLYLLARRLWNENIALLASFFLSISPFHIYYSQEVRMYTMLSCFAMFSWYFLERLIRTKQALSIVGYLVITSLLLYTHYMGFFILLSQVIYLLWIKKTKKFMFHLLVPVLLWSPWIPQFLIQLQNGMQANTFLPGWEEILKIPFFKSLPLILFKFEAGRISFDNKLFYFIILLIVVLPTLFLLLKILFGKRGMSEKMVISWFWVPLIASILISFKVPLDQPFRLIAILPVFYLLLAVVSTKLKHFSKLFLGLIIVVSLLGNFLYFTEAKFQREQWRQASKFVVEHGDKNSAIIFIWDQPFAPYTLYAHDFQAVSVANSFPVTRDQVEKNLFAVKTKDKVFLFEYLSMLSDPNHETVKWLERNGFKNTNTYDYPGVGFVYLYTK
jgi:mannosyltransferase